MHAAWKTLLSWADAHPLLAATVLATAAAGVLSSVWYAVRRAVWPGVETARLPTWARVTQALVELLVNLPGAIRALGATPSSPPGATEHRATLPPSAPAALALAVLVGLGGLQGCGPTLEAGRTLGGAPPVTGCTPRASRCRDALTPEVCSSSGRWWPQPACAVGCRVGPGGAHCAGPEGL